MSAEPSGLELRVPPLLAMLASAVLVFVFARLFPQYAQPVTTIHWAAAGMCLASAGILGISAIRQFMTARTTIHPQHPAKTSTLVRDGIYSFSRNPMYLGLAMLLGAEVALLANPAGMLPVVFFILYISRFQIEPEERILRAKYGAEFDRYCRMVRRWL